MYKQASLPTTCAATYATLAENQIDAGLDKLIKTSLASCDGDIQAYSDRLDELYDECASTNLDFSTTMKKAIFRRGLPQRLRMEAAIVQASELYTLSPNPQIYLVVVLQAIQAGLLLDGTSSPVEQASPPAETSSSATKRRPENEGEDTAVLLVTSKKPKLVAAAATAVAPADGGPTNYTVQLSPVTSKKPKLVASAAAAIAPAISGPTTYAVQKTKQGSETDTLEANNPVSVEKSPIDLSMESFEAGQKATTPLTDPFSEILKAVTHLIADRDYDAAIEDPLKCYNPSELPRLDPTMCPGFCITPDGESDKGATIQVSHEHALGVATGWIRSAAVRSGNKVRRDRVLVLNMYHAGRDPKFAGDYDLGKRGSQEELCHRTNFGITALPTEPDEIVLDEDCVAYSPMVVILRESYEKGHAWCDLSKPADLHVVSVASLGANPKPVLTDTTPARFANVSDHESVKNRWRNLLRLAGLKGHSRLVLGMLGCEHQERAPVEEIAECFLEVVGEQEFKGGWFEKITFAMPDRRSNRHKARNILQGKVCG